MYLFSGALPLQYVPARVTRRALVLIAVGFLAVGLLSTAEHLCPSRRLFGTILVTLCLMVWNWRVLRAEPMLFFWPNLLFSLSKIVIPFFFLPYVCCVGLGLRIDRVVSLSPDHALLTLF